MYQYVGRDFELLVAKKLKDNSEYYEKIDSYFSEKEEIQANDMTGIFEGRNLIFIMMESMDDWLITEETTPTIKYTMEDEVSRYAVEKEYGSTMQGNISEFDIIRAKAKLTDQMMSELLDALEKLSAANGNEILERTPAFIYLFGLEEPMAVDKVMKTTDLVPTIANLFNLERRKEQMGSDIFDERYQGYAVFPGGSWIKGQTYVKSGHVVYNADMSEKEIDEMNEWVAETYEINDFILDCDYYRYLQKKYSN